MTFISCWYVFTHCPLFFPQFPRHFFSFFKLLGFCTWSKLVCMRRSGTSCYLFLITEGKHSAPLTVQCLDQILPHL